MPPAIKVENLSKQYRLGQIGTGSIAHDVNRWWHTIRGKEDPYIKIGEVNDRTTAGNSEYVWSLKDINFTIEQGDAVGIIGRNGAGKSTLLKILSRVTSPTTGTVKAKGRIASLLEVGTGFHPELSGRENIFLNGAILGMRKKEIEKKFDEIVDFAGVERYIDTPVKRYSSGMYVRLAFGVAAYLESEILIVDEVLAVGDAEFQKKCLGKMDDVSKGEGRTVLFVSHNVVAIKQLCNKGILLKNGISIANGEIEKVISLYLEEIKTNAFYGIKNEKSGVKGFFTSVYLYNGENENSNVFKGGSNASVELTYKVNGDYLNFNVGMLLSDIFGNHIYSSADTDLNPELLLKRYSGTYSVRIPLPLFNLNTGNYTVKFLMGIVNSELFDSVELSFSIEQDNFINTGSRPGLLISLNKWEYNV